MLFRSVTENKSGFYFGKEHMYELRGITFLVRIMPQVQHAYLSDIGPIKFFIYCLILSLSLLLWILKLPNNLTLHLRL